MDESVIKHLEQPAKVLKLSEAIRIGAAKTGQCSTVYFDGINTCAIGAAHVGVGSDPGRLMITHMDGWQRDPAACAMSGSLALQAIGYIVPISVSAEIVVRNDSGESRESIADWLESRGY